MRSMGAPDVFVIVAVESMRIARSPYRTARSTAYVASRFTLVRFATPGWIAVARVRLCVGRAAGAPPAALEEVGPGAVAAAAGGIVITSSSAPRTTRRWVGRRWRGASGLIRP